MKDSYLETTLMSGGHSPQGDWVLRVMLYNVNCEQTRSLDCKATGCLIEIDKMKK
jgi:hypothetical protein